MIKPISFGSAYKAYITKSDCASGIYGHSALVNFCESEQIPIEQKYNYESKTIEGSGGLKTVASKYDKDIDEYVFSTYIINAPDEYDAQIEDICASKGIKFTRISSDVTNAENIKKRINPPKKGYSLAFVDAEKLLGLTITQRNNNFEHCRKDYDYYYKTKTDSAIKSGDMIDASTLSVKYTSDDTSCEALRNYVDKYGVDGLNPESVSLNLSQREGEGGINMFYGLLNAGIKDIPVYMDKESLQNAKTLGLLSK